ncbi:MAG: NADH-quinone oxidoreductase subunit A [Phycisphaerales bacterium]|nr:NADH-quinone oxidoreductase subunit A [Phycisphaerales bacterium]
MLAQAATTDAMVPYAAILVVFAIAVAMALAILILTHLIGPKRHGEVKQGVYESGMPPIADARRRFNVRFYIVAMLFLLFDVEVIILWPWALAFYEAATGSTPIDPAGLMTKGFLLGGAGIFLILLLVGYIYEWRKGVFRWD